MHKRILHVDIDAFFASVEKLLIPSLREKPVAVGSGCIASCCYIARKYGLRAGTSLSEARRICPELVILPGNYQVYHAFNERVWGILKRFSPDVETQLDDAYLDVSEPQLGKPGEIARGIKEAVRQETGLTVTIGGGPSKVVARIAGKTVKPDGLCVVPDDKVADFLAPLPVGYIPGVGGKAGAILDKLNIHTIAQLRMLSRRELAAMFGLPGEIIYERAKGIDSRIVVQKKIPKSISRQSTFHKETTDPDEIRGMLYYLTERAAQAARSLGIAPRTAVVLLRYADYESADARIKLPAPSNITDEIFDKAWEGLVRIRTRRVAVRLVGIVLSGFVAAKNIHATLFDTEEDLKRGRLTKALDAVRSRFGFSAVTAGPSIMLHKTLDSNASGFVLRTPSLTK